MRGTSDEPLNTPRAWAIDIAACMATGAVLGVIGPFGSFLNDTLAVRVAYWTVVFLISGVVFALAVRAVRRRAARAGVPIWVWVPALAVVLSAPLTVVTRPIAIALWPGIRHAVGWVEWYGQSLIVGLIYLGLYAAFRLRSPAPAGAGAGDDPPATILRRLPPKLGRDLLCLQMEDHYVRLHTVQGSTLALMSLGQAMAEVVGIEGLQVHRSWWVARHAVRAVVEDGRNLKLSLVNGLEAPVSRNSVARLKAAGWLDRRS